MVWSKLTIVFHYDLFHDQFFGVHLLAISWIDISNQGKGKERKGKGKGKGKGKEMKRKGIYAVYLIFRLLHLFYNYCFLHNQVVWSKLTIVFHHDVFRDQFFGVHLLAISWIDISNQGKKERERKGKEGKERERKGKGKGKERERKYERDIWVYLIFRPLHMFYN